jgi:hypothetical protein
MSALSRGTRDMRTKELTRRSTAAKMAPRDAPQLKPTYPSRLASTSSRENEEVNPAPHLGDFLNDPVLVVRLEFDDVLAVACVGRIGE